MIVKANPESFNLPQPDVNLIDRIESGLAFIYKLNFAGHKCTNLFAKYECEKCSSELRLCRACKKLIELEKQYYIFQIIDIINKYIKKENALLAKRHMEQQNLFRR